jgi:hypothetical protein
MLRLCIPLLACILALSACGGSPEEESSASTSIGTNPDVGSIAVDPGDGTMIVSIGPKFFRFKPGSDKPEVGAGNIKTPKGAGSLTRDVVVRYAGPGVLYASGHSGTAALPAVLGFVKSTDHGENWEPISGMETADYHEIEVVGDSVFAMAAEEPGMIQVSTDGGKTFEAVEAPSVALPIDIAVNPDDLDHWAVSNDQGVFISKNAGKSWRQRDTTFGPRLTWSAPDALFSAGLDGTVRRSSDGGATWQEVGSIGAGPKEFVTGPKGELYASISGGDVLRSTDGGATWEKLLNVVEADGSS